MKLRRLSVRRMPGFEDRGFDLDGFSDGISVIIGPNASGKTTACRAIRGLLWPETLQEASPVSLAGWFGDGPDTLQLQLEGTAAACMRNGVPADRPPLPPAHLADCFTVTVGDLYHGTGADRDLAAELAREMAGGYDPGRLRELEQFRLSPRIGQSEARALDEANEKVRSIEADQRALQRQEQDLADLERREQQARQADARLQTLERARQLLTVRADIRQAETLVQSYPQGMELLRGDEPERVEQIQDDLEQAEAELHEAEQAAEEARRDIADADLPEEGIPEASLREQTERLEQLREIEQGLDQCHERTGQARAQLDTARKALGDDTAAEADADRLETLQAADLDQVQRFQLSWEELQSRRSALQARLGVLGDEQQVGDTDTLVSGIHLLRQWFEAGSAQADAGGGLRGLAWALVALVAALGVALAALVHLLWLLLLLPAGMAAVGAYLLGRPAAEHPRAGIQDQYLRLSLPTPEQWEREAVGKLLSALEADLARARQAERDSAERKSIQADLEQISEQAEALEQTREELTRRLGAAPDSSPLALTWLAANLLDYQQARTEMQTCSRETERLSARHRELLEQVNSYLAQFGAGAAEDYRSARVQVEAVAGRAERHRRATEALAEAGRQRAHAQKQRAEFVARRQKLYSDIGLEDDDRWGLQQRLEALEAYRQTAEQLRSLRASEQGLLGELEQTPDMLELSAEQTEAETARLEQIVAEREQVLEQIVRIRSQLESVSRGSSLQDALAEADQARQRLAGRRDRAAFAAAAMFLLDGVQAEYEADSQPAVLRQASEWLGHFTRGRYELKLDDSAGPGQARFRGHDTVADTGLALEQLSGGTRMQLLLAVRLAAAAEAERGTALPFVLDEVLSSSDPVRFRAIIECVLAMARQGRQVLYFTCQPSDALAWQQVAEQMGLEQACRIDLADALTDQAVAEQLLSTSAAAVEPIPEPAGRSLEQYLGDLRVPPLQPSAGADAAHVAHLVTCPEQLYRLLAAGIEHFGQLRTLAAHGSAEGYVSAEQFEQVQRQALVVDAFAEAWTVGRGPRLSRQVLQEAGVTDAFIDRIADLAADLEWDARRLAAALGAREDERTRGFREATLERVVENLTEWGYLPVDQPLGREALFARVQAAMSEPIRRGRADAADVRRLLERLWALACGAQD